MITPPEYQIEVELLLFPIFSAQWFGNKGEHFKFLCINAVRKTDESAIRVPHEKASS